MKFQYTYIQCCNAIAAVSTDAIATATAIAI